MELIRPPRPGKSRLSEDHLDQVNIEEDFGIPVKPEKKIPPSKIGLILFGLFILLVIISVFIRMYTQEVPNSELDDGEEIVMEKDIEELEIDEDKLSLSEENVLYEEPERIYHIEKRQQFCAIDIEQARDLYSEYVSVKNSQVMEIRPAHVGEEQWIKEKRLQGAYRDNLGEREEDFYYEYPTTAGPYVDVMRIHKCEVFDPGGRIIPIISIEEDGFIPEYELGHMVLEDWSEEEMITYIKYLISLRHEEEDIQNIKKKSSGDYLTLTLEMSYNGTADWLRLKKNQEVYSESIYKLNLKTGLLEYSAQLLARDIIIEEDLE
jgi:hypothetical protein